MRIKQAKNEKISYLLPLLVDSCWLDGLLTYWLPLLVGGDRIKEKGERRKEEKERKQRKKRKYPTFYYCWQMVYWLVTGWWLLGYWLPPPSLLIERYRRKGEKRRIKRKNVRIEKRPFFYSCWQTGLLAGNWLLVGWSLVTSSPLMRQDKGEKRKMKIKKADKEKISYLLLLLVDGLLAGNWLVVGWLVSLLTSSPRVSQIPGIKHKDTTSSTD